VTTCTSWLGQEKLFFLPPFFQYNKRLLRQNTGGACWYMPQNGHWLASFEVTPLIPSEKFLNRVFRCQKMITPGVRTAVFYYSFWSKNADHIFLLLFFGRFFGNFVTPISTLCCSNQINSYSLILCRALRRERCSVSASTACPSPSASARPQASAPPACGALIGCPAPLPRPGSRG